MLSPSDQTPETGDDLPDALIAALAEIERHVGKQGWDQPARLFALVRTDELVRAEPSLAEHLSVGSPDSLSSIEQEDFHGGDDLFEVLQKIQWPATVAGCAISLERAFLPPKFESEIPDDPDKAADFVNHHPSKQDVRVVVGAMRDGSRHGLARLRSNPDELLGGEELVPNLADILFDTLR